MEGNVDAFKVETVYTGQPVTIILSLSQMHHTVRSRFQKQASYQLKKIFFANYNIYFSAHHGLVEEPNTSICINR